MWLVARSACIILHAYHRWRRVVLSALSRRDAWWTRRLEQRPTTIWSPASDSQLGVHAHDRAPPPASSQALAHLRPEGHNRVRWYVRNDCSILPRAAFARARARITLHNHELYPFSPRHLATIIVSQSHREPCRLTQLPTLRQETAAVEIDVAGAAAATTPQLQALLPLRLRQRQRLRIWLG